MPCYDSDIPHLRGTRCWWHRLKDSDYLVILDLQVLHEKIVHKLDLNCEHLESILGWQHDLKDVECHVGDGKTLNWNALSDNSLNLQKRPKLHATFKW